VDGRHYPYELERMYKNWQDPAQRTRLEKMLIRSTDEQTGEVIENRIKNVIYSGKKDVYELRLTNGQIVAGSLDHKIFTSEGWSTIGDLMEAPKPVVVFNPDAFNKVPQVEVFREDKEWKAIPGWEGKYEVSDGGNVRSLLNTRGNPLKAPVVKK